MDRLITLVCGTNKELFQHTRPLLSTEIALNTTTGEMRRGPGMWIDLQEFEEDDVKDLTVRVAATSNVVIATGLNNGDTLDGETLVTGDIVALTAQTDAAQNGIYVVAASPARHPDFATFNAHPGVVIGITDGTQSGKVLMCNVVPGGTLGTTGIYFKRILLNPLLINEASQFNALPTATPVGTDLIMVQRADGSQASVLLSALKTYMNA